MILYTVYKNPIDYPGKFVVRRFENDVPDATPLAVETTIEQARSAIPEGFYNIGRCPDDEPQILEVHI